MTKEEEQYVEDLEIELRGLAAKITQLLKWGGLIVQELDECMRRRKIITSQISSITGEKPDTSLDSVIKGAVRQAVSISSGNKTQAAKVLGISRRSLYRKLDRFAVCGSVEKG